jgi:isoquinoline 1-oxidoreductase alpha subunit
MAFSILINGEPETVDVDGDTPLLWVLRDVLGLTGAKFGCAVGLCGACTVHIDGVARRSCTLPVAKIGSSRVTTIEKIGSTPIGAKVQAAWVDVDVPQCGYCQPGQVMSASALLAKTPQPSDEQIDAAMNGNVCRCGTYARIKAAIHKAAQA